MFKTKHQYIFIAVIVMMAVLLTSCSFEKEDETPPTAPLLTVSDVSSEVVSLAWSESYDNIGVDEYRLYKDGEVLAKLSKTKYEDKEVIPGEEYEYYVVAYDEAGNRSSKSVKQNVKIVDSTVEPQDPGPTASINIQKLSRSTIKLYTLDDDFNVIAMGSGTIVNNNGYILTNFHCVGENGSLYNSEGYVAIAITDDIKKNIQPQYIAQYRSGVEELDLAVVKLVADLNWNQLSATDLNLEPAKISDSDSVELGDDINILGYPGVGGETITFTAGHVSGFIDDDGDSVIDWIKTDAVVNHGNSGGTAINGKGEMIGVPTAKLVGEDNDIMFYLKPINQALPVLDDAIAQGDDPIFPTPSTPTPGIDDPVYGEGVAIYGRIVDSYTEEPIPGASFVFLQAGVTIDDFINNPQDSMILSYGEADDSGMFVCFYIPSGAAYSVLVVAEGYLPIMEDNAIEIPADWYEDVDLGDVYLEME